MQLNQLIDLMSRKNATQLVMASDAPPQILSYGQWSAAGTPLSSERLQALLKTVTPPHLQSEFNKPNATYEWTHFASSGKYKIHIQSVSGARTLTITQELAARGSTPATLHAARQASDAAMQTNVQSLPVEAPRASVPPPLSPHLQTKSDHDHLQSWSPPTAGEERAQKIVVFGALTIVALLVFSFIGYCVAYTQNSKRDYSDEFEVAVVKKYNERGEAPQLSDVELTRDSEKKSHYEGKGRFSDGDNALVSVDIENRDKLNRPDNWTWNVSPYNYGPMLAGEIKLHANERYAGRGSWARVRNITLYRNSRTSYSGEVVFMDDDKGDIGVEVHTFNADGAPATWTYSIAPRSSY